MAAAALIKYVQGASTPAAGLALIGVLSTTVVASNDNNLGVSTWEWKILDVPPGSTVPTGVVSTASTYSFSPDKRGGYLLQLTVTDSLGRQYIDKRCFQVAEPNGLIIPPFMAEATALNFSGQARGWAKYMEEWLRLESSSTARVRAVATANVTLSGPQTVDGVSIVADDYVLCTAQTTAANRRIYQCKAGTWVASILDDGRSASGITVWVDEGTVNHDSQWICTNNIGSDVVGTNTLVWVNNTSFASTFASPADVRLVSTVPTIASVTGIAQGGTGAGVVLWNEGTAPSTSPAANKLYSWVASDALRFRDSSGNFSAIGAGFISVSGTATASASGTLRFPISGSMTTRNSGGGDGTILSWSDAALVIGQTSADGPLTINYLCKSAGSHTWQVGTSFNAAWVDANSFNYTVQSVIWAQATPGNVTIAPSISQALRVGDNATSDIIFQAQGASTTSTGSNVNGGRVRLRGGTSRVDGTTGLRGGVSLELSSGGLVLGQAVEVAVGQYAWATCGAAGTAQLVTATHLPANAGKLVRTLGECNTRPSTGNPVGVVVEYVSGGNLFRKTTSGHDQAIGGLFVTRVWPSDANYTAVVGDYTATQLELTGGSLSAQRNLVMPLLGGWWIVNKTTGGQSIQIIGASGTGIIIGPDKTAFVFGDGTNMRRGSTDV